MPTLNLLRFLQGCYPMIKYSGLTKIRTRRRSRRQYR
ncbi:glycosyl transferase family 1 [Neisseria meningitidis]|nr:glycosyl transferase family 1 [Neisseria meningitidis]MBG8603641.1 glycosyl transferase family 1 [Neisseria meningitidis]MBG8744226.1 glycosyl transferase family 1 [Neisseria meningitidis]MBJ7819742.1 glycosyl transferase family 1 [Neisseria meningitidis]